MMEAGAPCPFPSATIGGYLHDYALLHHQAFNQIKGSDTAFRDSCWVGQASSTTFSRRREWMSHLECNTHSCSAAMFNSTLMIAALDIRTRHPQIDAASLSSGSTVLDLSAISEFYVSYEHVSGAAIISISR